MKIFRILIYRIIVVSFSPLFFLTLLVSALIVRFSISKSQKPRLVWGSTPLINNSYWSKSMVMAGFVSHTYTFDFYSSINNRNDWDRILSEEFPFVPRPIKPFFAFIVSLYKYDIFFISFNGFFIGNTPLRSLQAHFLKLAGKKVIVIPYGSDSYVYRNIRSVGLIHGLLMSYPQASVQQERIFRDVEYWVRYADAVLPGFMCSDGFGRWDALTPSPLVLDLQTWKPSIRNNSSTGMRDYVVVAHAPNHRGFKGTEFVLHAVDQLCAEGYKVKLVLLEKIQNNEVRRILYEEVDILVDQIVFTGYALNALEGMASGLPTISNLDDKTYVVPMRRWSYFNECPLVSATPENLIDVLRKLVNRPHLRKELGKAGRQYAEKYHGFESAQYLFSNLIEYVHGRKTSLMNLYHPLLGEYPNRSPKIEHPLVENHIID